jgi:TolB-like protein/cytochrome c-type biogenesis protein CcmH/NrfG
MSFVTELRRRNVFRVAAAYLVVGWLLTEVLTTILPTLGAPEWASRAVILIFAFGFIPAVVLSWFYEISAEGIKLDHKVDRDDPANRRAAKKFERISIVGAVVLIVFVGLFSARYTAQDVVESDTDTGVVATSVAVLPFVNMSDDADNEYFSDGLTETLLHMLAQIPDLKVAARTSSFAFKDQNRSIQEIARALEVAHVLEGSVQRVGDRVRITAQLIRASDGFHVWSEVYDRTLDDIFGIQDEIAGKVGNALSASLLGDSADTRFAGVTTTDPDAYDLYLQARKARATYSYGGLQEAEDLLKGALLIDPEFTDAKVELASSYVHQLETGLMDKQTAVAEIIAISDQALEERPDDPVARATSIYAKAISLASQGDMDAMPDLINELEAIVARAPAEPEPRMLLVRAYKSLQRFEDCIPVIEGALSLDPFNPALHYELGTAYIELQEIDKARAALERSLELEPAQPNAYTYLGALSLYEGDGVGYVSHFLKAVAVDPRDHELPGMLAKFLYELGIVDVADEFRRRVKMLSPNSAIAYQLDIARAKAMGDTEAAIAAARRAVQDDIEDRRFAYGGAVQYLIRTAVAEGRVEEELAWIETQKPGVFDLDAAQIPSKLRTVQAVAFDGWAETLPRDELLKRLNAQLGYASSMGIDPTENPNSHISILVLQGRIDDAIEVALAEIFTQSVAMHLHWRDMLMQPRYAELLADQRVQEAIERWEDEEAALRGAVQSYFADLHAAR